MKIEQILSRRSYSKEYFFDIVYDWENIFSDVLHIPIVDEKFLFNNSALYIPFLTRCLQTDKKSFVFELGPDLYRFRTNNKKNICPCIIDFFLEPDQFEKFYHVYNRNPIVFISNAEVMEYLKIHNCPLKIEHLALSLPDKYKIDKNSKFEKKYDVVLMGRQNMVLMSFLKTYAKEHENFCYVYKIRGKNDDNFYYYTSHGDCLGDMKDNKDYINLMHQGRVGLYATPGIDGGEGRTKGFNPVTPRFLELISSGCHIIARYPENADTQFYELAKFSPSINTYKDFEIAMDKALSTDVDMNFYSEYLSKHYTSERIKQFKILIDNL